MLLKEEFITYISVEEGLQGKARGCGQETEAGIRRRPGPEPLLGSPEDRHGRWGIQFRVG